MHERIKQLRKALGLTQAEFGAKVGLKQNSVAIIESGRTTANATIKSICNAFNVSEDWLRNGEGEMFAPTFSANDELLLYITRLLKNEPESFQARFYRAMSTMPREFWGLVEKKAWELVGQEPPGAENGSEDDQFVT